MKRGDVIFFSKKNRIGSNATTDKQVHHVGIVSTVDHSSNRIEITEGNTGKDYVLKRWYTINPTTAIISGNGWNGEYFCGYISVGGSSTPTTCTFEYGLNGGSGAFSATSLNAGGTLTLPTTKPTKVGYVFKGWAAKRLGDQKWMSSKSGWVASSDVSANGGYRYYQPGAQLTISNSWLKGYSGTIAKFRFYAQWDAVESTIEFGLNGGSGTFNSVTKTYGSAIAIPSSKPAKSGYLFKGWALKRLADQKWMTEQGAWATSSSVASNGGYRLYASGTKSTLDSSWYKGFSGANTNFRFYAQWEKEQVTVKGSFSFGLNGGEGSFSSFTVTFGNAFTLPSAKPTLYGYTFKGWAAKRVSDDKWYTVSGGWQDYGNVSANGGYYLFAAGAGRTLNAGWFKGWSGGDASFRFHAQYALNAGMHECTVSYGLNGGSGTFATQTVVFGGKLTFHAGKPTKAGYTFKGWAVKRLNDSKWRSGYGRWVTASEIPDYDGYRLYQPGGTVTVDSNWSKQYTGSDTSYNYRLFAQWEPASGLAAGSIAE